MALNTGAGFASRAPECRLSQLLDAGITTVVGVTGTDSVTRSQVSWRTYQDTPRSVLSRTRAVQRVCAEARPRRLGYQLQELIDYRAVACSSPCLTRSTAEKWAGPE